MPIQLSKELAELVEGGSSMLVGTRDAALRPEVVRGVGAQVAQDRSTFTVYVPSELAARTLANLEHNGAIAVTFSQLSNHRTVQVKGKLRSLRRSRKNERHLLERYVAAFAEQVHFTGCSRRIVRRLRFWPSLALEVEVEDLFAQTPGPGAGRRIEPTA
jgi:general stress protein 26